MLKDNNFDYLETNQFTWLITGVAGFIGSNLLESLLLLNQRVVGLDNFSTGHRANLDMVEKSVGASQWLNFKFLEGDIGDLATCKKCCLGSTHRYHFCVATVLFCLQCLSQKLVVLDMYSFQQSAKCKMTLLTGTKYTLSTSEYFNWICN